MSHITYMTQITVDFKVLKCPIDVAKELKHAAIEKGLTRNELVVQILTAAAEKLK
jgi:hypothetical protein